MSIPDSLLAPEVTKKFVKDYGVRIGLRMHQVITARSDIDFFRCMVRFDRALEQEVISQKYAYADMLAELARGDLMAWVSRETLPRFKRAQAFYKPL